MLSSYTIKSWIFFVNFRCLPSWLTLSLLLENWALVLDSKYTDIHTLHYPLWTSIFSFFLYIYFLIELICAQGYRWHEDNAWVGLLRIVVALLFKSWGWESGIEENTYTSSLVKTLLQTYYRNEFKLWFFVVELTCLSSLCAGFSTESSMWSSWWAKGKVASPPSWWPPKLSSLPGIRPLALSGKEWQFTTWINKHASSPSLHVHLEWSGNRRICPKNNLSHAS